MNARREFNAGFGEAAQLAACGVTIHTGKVTIVEAENTKPRRRSHRKVLVQERIDVSTRGKTANFHGKSQAAVQRDLNHMASVELRNLSKRYGGLTVVDRVNLQIDHGKLVCLLGPSGCGKTTTLRLIAGFIEPSEGEIQVGEQVVSSPARTLPPEQRQMSMIFQSYALWPHMTVAENVAYGLTLRKLSRDTIAQKVAAILATMRLSPLAERYPGELSGGQQQRVALARALIVDPQTLLLDEPLSNLDANLREEMRFEVRRLHDEYRYTTVYVTHDQIEAMTTADLVAVMNSGRIEQLGTPHEIYERPKSQFVARFIGASNVVTGKVLDGSHIEISGKPVRCDSY